MHAFVFHSVIIATSQRETREAVAHVAKSHPGLKLKILAKVYNGTEPRSGESQSRAAAERERKGESGRREFFMMEFVFVGQHGEHPFTNTLAQRTYGKTGWRCVCAAENVLAAELNG